MIGITREAPEMRKARKAVASHWRTAALEVLNNEMKALETRYGVVAARCSFEMADNSELKQWSEEALLCSLKGKDLPPIPGLETPFT